MKTYKEYNTELNEAVRKLQDEKLDTFINDKWNGKATTYKYNSKAISELSLIQDVLISTDKKFFHIETKTTKNTKTKDILDKYKLQEV